MMKPVLFSTNGNRKLAEKSGNYQYVLLSLDKEFMFTYCNRDGEIEPLHAADYINNILKRIIRKHNLKRLAHMGSDTLTQP